jgi:ABC-type amino acid transport substrate-binding protein
LDDIAGLNQRMNSIKSRTAQAVAHAQMTMNTLTVQTAMKTILQTALLVAALLLLAGCATSKTPSAATNPAILRVGVAPDAPPMIFKQEGQVVGVEAELAEALGRELGRKVEFVELKREDLIDALCGNSVDIIMSSLPITPARRYRIAFTSPYLKVGQMALIRKQDKDKLMSALAGATKRGIAVERGSTAERLVRQQYPRAEVKYYYSGEETAAALTNQGVDLFVSDSPLILYLGGRYESTGLALSPWVFGEENLGWGVRQTDDRLRDEANAFLQKAQANGELKRILQRWMPGL